MISLKEIVLTSNEITKRVHKELFHFAEECYTFIDSSYAPSAISYLLDKDIERIHLALNWADIIRFGTWCQRPEKGDIILLLKKVGLSDNELQPFKGSLDDILAYLYYGKRFDILRRLCSEIKRKLEKNIKGSAKYNCHLIYEETGSIIASSL